MIVPVYTVELKLANNRIIIDDLKFLKGDAIKEVAKRGGHWKVARIEIDVSLDKIKQLPFFEWLVCIHPDVRLTRRQINWVAAMERGEQYVWTGGRGSGKSFIFNLYKEYREGKDA